MTTIPPFIPHADPPQTRLSIQSNAEVAQLTCQPGTFDGTLYLANEDSSIVMSVPSKWLPTLRPTEPVLVAVVLTRVMVEPVEPAPFAPPKLVV